jgi:hypothetical protein
MELGDGTQAAGQHYPYAPLNHFYNVRDLATAEYRDGGCPINDTLYSIAWVDVTKEPVILSHPEMGDRYFTFELAGLDSDNFAYVGQQRMKQPWTLPWTSGSPRPELPWPSGTRAGSGPSRPIRCTGSPGTPGGKPGARRRSAAATW